jgi:purine-binding chemotaxis protein CheW
VTPIVDVRSALSGVTLDTSEATRIILVKAAEKAIGLVVDAATDVLEITTDSIQQANLMESKDVSYLKGIAKIDDRLIILLDIEMLLEDTTNLDELREIIDTL